ncbi:MAG: Gfo/Idh/MocA family protein [Acidimicrobiales bacterium]
MNSPVSVGVLGSTSMVARLAVIPAIENSSRCTLAATASLSDASATYSSYDALLEDPDVEAVYIPLPNSLHREWTERSASAGKHVLCEKPLAANAPDALAMAQACAAAGVVLMEAYMTRFHPRDRKIQQLVSEGVIGDLLFTTAAFTGELRRADDHRWRPEMGGGALLDVGIYCLTPMLAAAGIDLTKPDGLNYVTGVAHRAPLGVDASYSGWLDLGEGRSASFQCSFEAPERQMLEIVGADAALFVKRAFTPGPDDHVIQVRRKDRSSEDVTTEGANPYLLMVEHFGAVIRGEAELARTPAESVALQLLVDRFIEAVAPPTT